MTRSLNTLFVEIQQERNRQDEKWGIQNHHILEWIPILGEEVGEVNKAALEYHFRYKNSKSTAQYRKELVQVAAVACAMIECLDRQEEAS